MSSFTCCPPSGPCEAVAGMSGSTCKHVMVAGSGKKQWAGFARRSCSLGCALAEQMKIMLHHCFLIGFVLPVELWVHGPSMAPRLFSMFVLSGRVGTSAPQWKCESCYSQNRINMSADACVSIVNAWGCEQRGGVRTISHGSEPLA